MSQKASKARTSGSLLTCSRAAPRAWPTGREIGLSGHAWGWLPPITSDRTRSGACSPIPKQSPPPFLDGEGLDQIVVGAAVQSGDAVA